MLYHPISDKHKWSKISSVSIYGLSVDLTYSNFFSLSMLEEATEGGKHFVSYS